MSKEGIDVFIEYLDNMEEMIDMFKGMKIASEMMGDTTISEEQAEVSNAYLKECQKEWEKGFVNLLEYGINWLKRKEESKGDVE